MTRCSWPDCPGSALGWSALYPDRCKDHQALGVYPGLGTVSDEVDRLREREHDDRLAEEDRRENWRDYE